MCNKKCEVVFNQYRKLYVIRVTWTRDPLCDIYVHFKHSSLNIWGKGAPFIRPLSFSPFICLDDNRLSWDSQPSLPWLVWPEPWHKTCLFFSDSLPQQGYLTIGVRRGKTPQTSQLRQHTPSQGWQEKTPCVDICVNLQSDCITSHGIFIWYHFCTMVKGIVHPRTTIMWLITHSHVVLNL